MPVHTPNLYHPTNIVSKEFVKNLAEKAGSAIKLYTDVKKTDVKIKKKAKTNKK
jgi:hypothetical protein